MTPPAPENAAPWQVAVIAKSQRSLPCSPGNRLCLLFEPTCQGDGMVWAPYAPHAPCRVSFPATLTTKPSARSWNAVATSSPSNKTDESMSSTPTSNLQAAHAGRSVARDARPAPCRGFVGDRGRNRSQASPAVISCNIHCDSGCGATRGVPAVGRPFHGPLRSHTPCFWHRCPALSRLLRSYAASGSGPIRIVRSFGRGSRLFCHVGVSKTPDPLPRKENVVRKGDASSGG